jgi:hypothetical protein
MKLKINWVGAAVAWRTAGALMLGNSVVGAFLFNKSMADLWLLAVIGVCVILIFSLENKG